VSEDLTARVAELAAAIEAHLAEDEAAALAWDDAPWLYAGTEATSWRPVGKREVFYDNGRSETVQVIDVSGAASLWTEAIQVKWDTDGSRVKHIARNDPARVLRRVKATRDLVAEILAEPHYYDDREGGFFSCSQAVYPEPWRLDETDDPGPGSGCSNEDRAGKPCDCGRDARVARLLGIIASEWEGDGHGGS